MSNRHKLSDEELLNWAMNQLYRSARYMQLTSLDTIYSTGCDLTAKTILERLKSTKSGRNLIKETNPTLLK